MSDNLMTIAASVACVQAGLSPKESLALTAAASVIDGPLAIVPAIVAIERFRREHRGGDRGPTGQPPVSAAG